MCSFLLCPSRSLFLHCMFHRHLLGSTSHDSAALRKTQHLATDSSTAKTEQKWYRNRTHATTTVVAEHLAALPRHSTRHSNTSRRCCTRTDSHHQIPTSNHLLPSSLSDPCLSCRTTGAFLIHCLCLWTSFLLWCDSARESSGRRGGCYAASAARRLAATDVAGPRGVPGIVAGQRQ